MNTRLPIAVSVLTLCAGAVCTPAHSAGVFAAAQESNAALQSGPFRNLVEIRIDDRPFNALLTEAGLTEEQRAQATVAFEAYTAELDRQNAELNRSVIRRLGAESPDGAMMALRSLEPAAAADFNDWLHRGVRGIRTRAEWAREKLLTDVEAVLTEEQSKNWGGAVRSLNRRMYLNPTIDPTGPNSAVDLGVRVDLNDLVADASKDGEELQRILGTADIAFSSEDVREARVVIVEGLTRYDERLDVLLPAMVYGDMDAKQALRSASFRGDSTEAARLHKDRIRSKRALFDLNEAVASEIGNAVAAVDTDASAAWLQRVDRAHFPETMRPTTVDRMMEWLAARPNIDDETRHRLAAAYVAFVPLRDSLWGRAKPLILRMHEEVSKYVAGSEENDVFEKLDEFDARIAEACANAHASLLALIPSEQQEAYHQALSLVERQSGVFFDTRETLRRPHDLSRPSNRSEDRRDQEAHYR